MTTAATFNVLARWTSLTVCCLLGVVWLLGLHGRFAYDRPGFQCRSSEGRLTIGTLPLDRASTGWVLEYGQACNPSFWEVPWDTWSGEYIPRWQIAPLPIVFSQQIRTADRNTYDGDEYGNPIVWSAGHQVVRYANGTEKAIGSEYWGESVSLVTEDGGQISGYLRTPNEFEYRGYVRLDKRFELSIRLWLILAANGLVTLLLWSRRLLARWRSPPTRVPRRSIPRRAIRGAGVVIGVALAIAWALTYEWHVGYDIFDRGSGRYISFVTSFGGVAVDLYETDADLPRLLNSPEHLVFPASNWAGDSQLTFDRVSIGLSTFWPYPPLLPEYTRKCFPMRISKDCAVRHGGGCFARSASFHVRSLWLPLWIPLALTLAPTALSIWRNRSVTSERCNHCLYDLTGNMSSDCPECGMVIRGRHGNPAYAEQLAMFDVLESAGASDAIRLPKSIDR